MLAQTTLNKSQSRANFQCRNAQKVDEFGYKGEKLSLNFQRITVRAALQVIADFTGLNFVTSDAVSGDLSLRLKDVPWDQALDVILQTKGLAMRQKGNVVWVAPAEEIAQKEKQALEAKNAVVELEQQTLRFLSKQSTTEQCRKI